jgi:hypothetical protein
MIHVGPQTLEKLIGYCNEKWIKASDEQAAAQAQDIDLLTGRKMAYDDVLQHARSLLADVADR